MNVYFENELRSNLPAKKIPSTPSWEPYTETLPNSSPHSLSNLPCSEFSFSVHTGLGQQGRKAMLTAETPTLHSAFFQNLQLRLDWVQNWCKLYNKPPIKSRTTSNHGILQRVKICNDVKHLHCIPVVRDVIRLSSCQQSKASLEYESI